MLPISGACTARRAIVECSAAFPVATRTLEAERLALEMPNITLRQVRAIADRLGHRDLSVMPTRRGYRAHCACGYESTTRRTPADAASAAAHHLELIARAWSDSGAALPVDDTPTEEPFESRTRSIA